jgi:ribosomal protein L1
VTKNNNIDAGLGRIKHLHEELARAPVRSGRRRQFARTIRIEADLDRKSLDTAQASQQFDAKLALPLTGRASRLGIPIKSRGLH